MSHTCCVGFSSCSCQGEETDYLALRSAQSAFAEGLSRVPKRHKRTPYSTADYRRMNADTMRRAPFVAPQPTDVDVALAIIVHRDRFALPKASKLPTDPGSIPADDDAAEFLANADAAIEEEAIDPIDEEEEGNELEEDAEIEPTETEIDEMERVA